MAKKSRKISSKLELMGLLTAGALALLPAEKGHAKDLADYLDTSAIGYDHVHVNVNWPVGSVTGPSENFHAIEDGIAFSATATQPLRVHVYPKSGGWIAQGLEYQLDQDNLEIVGHSEGEASVIPDNFVNDQVAPASSDHVTILSPVNITGSGTSFVNMLLMTGNSTSLIADNLANTHIYNNFLTKGGDLNRFGASIRVGVDSATVENNVFNNFYRESDPTTGSAINVEGQNVILYDNVFSNSRRGINIFDTADLNIGDATRPGNNVFYRSRSWNIEAEIGDIGVVPAENNTWYPVTEGAQLAGPSQPYEPLVSNEDIQATIMIENPTVKQLKIKDQAIYSEQTVKEVDTFPFNAYDVLGRFQRPLGLTPASNDHWNLYDAQGNSVRSRSDRIDDAYKASVRDFEAEQKATPYSLTLEDW